MPTFHLITDNNALHSAFTAQALKNGIVIEPQFNQVNPVYDGESYFWAYAYRHYLRDCTNAQRTAVRANFIANGLELSSESDMHETIIKETIHFNRNF